MNSYEVHYRFNQLADWTKKDFQTLSNARTFVRECVLGQVERKDSGRTQFRIYKLIESQNLFVDGDSFHNMVNYWKGSDE